MPFAVTHVLVPIIVVDLIRDHVLKRLNKFKMLGMRPSLLPNRYVFLAGIAGLVLDMDLPVVTALNKLLALGIESHRLILHNIWVPLSFLAFFAVFNYASAARDRKFALVFLMLFAGTSMHLLLDAALTGEIMPFYPLSTETVDWNVFGKVADMAGMDMITLLVSMDALLLLFWLWHEEFTHKISDYF
jgi:membrane-bound metal-dependent hydrolase YbcI (DUF457 family)